MSKPPIGLKRGSVQLLPHQSAWAALFESEKSLLLPVIGGRPIEHVGSTAIPGLHAKPIIDIAVAVSRLEETEAMIQPLAGLGYEFRSEAGTPGRRFFAKGPESNRTVYLHFGLPEGEFGQLVQFRDALRADPALVHEYEQLKLKLAQDHPDDRATYTRGKAGFIQEVIKGG